MNTLHFRNLNLIAPIQRAIGEEGYNTPTAVQAAAIPPALEGRDILGCAQTGTGKTAAFALPILNRLAELRREALPHAPQALILAPTRELAAQIGESLATYGRHLRLRHTVVYGGVGQAKQVRDLSRGVHMLVATPGRLMDLMQQGHVRLDRLQVFVLDEADRMLDMGFLPAIHRIVAKLPAQRQSLFFSATLPRPIIELVERLATDPVRINVTPKSSSVDRIEQRVVFVEKTRKRELLARVLKTDSIGRAVVFTRTKRGADVVAKHLAHAGIAAAAIHGSKSQNNRERTLSQFRGDGIQVLVATDVAARGLDVDGVTHVVNFEVPNEPESYIHRVGRTGRAGATGIAVTFCDASERAELKAIERLLGRAIPVHGGQPVASESFDASHRGIQAGSPVHPSRGKRRGDHGRPGGAKDGTGTPNAKRSRRRRRTGTRTNRPAVSHAIA